MFLCNHCYVAIVTLLYASLVSTTEELLDRKVGVPV
jgi:hypothetical protein